ERIANNADSWCDGSIPQIARIDLGSGNRETNHQFSINAASGSCRTPFCRAPNKKSSMISNRPFTWPRLRRLFGSLFIVAAAVAALGAFGSSHATNQASSSEQTTIATKIAPWVMEHTTNGQQAEFFVVLADQADLSGAAALPAKNEKGRYVYDVLRNKSQASQGPLLQLLRERGLEHQSFYIVNAILVK